MPGEASPGAWIKHRAKRIMKEGETKGQYGKKKGKSIAYAIAVQQAHKLGKSPKHFRTAGGVQEAKQKFDLPKKEYQKTAEATLAAFFDERDKIAEADKQPSKSFSEKYRKFVSHPVTHAAVGAAAGPSLVDLAHGISTKFKGDAPKWGKKHLAASAITAAGMGGLRLYQKRKENLEKKSALGMDLRLKGPGGIRRPPFATEGAKSQAFSSLKQSQKVGQLGVAPKAPMPNYRGAATMV
jgi:hypothetical protein